ncbi:hypothetical protein Nepgr_022109 [Nepenthes gracilis]|uniref:Protein RALF-like 32 n=1 Tax=Nepenthes gracilis TaxID=150966 RepID=A0AAD3SY10_NEPGR|nr:hypothetical protein Nepgr_022109 [Nepenthes gracilis]
MEAKSLKNRLSRFSFLLCLLCLAGGAAGKSTGEFAQCNRSIAACEEENEMLMESEISWRILEETRYITYGALKPNEPACNSGTRGGPYADCLPPPSNPQTRPCSKYYRCQRDGE